MNNFNFDNSYLTLPQTFYSLVKPSIPNNTEFVLVNEELFLSLDIENWDKNQIYDILSGKTIDKFSTPFAQAYAGHQFGHFNILGDGRAIVLGEHITDDNKRFDIQLKGSGKTPYSRSGDGKATQRAMFREYLISEAMYHLNIPTSRSLVVFKTGEEVYREYIDDGAALIRIMKSHIRIGTFEYGGYIGTKEDLEKLLNYTVNRLYPNIKNSGNIALSFLIEIIKSQIELVTNWMRVGFIHGVMNTDNCAISGETFDYGPCAFMNSYDPKTVFSSIDRNGRYSFGNQPKILKWNLTKLAQFLLPLIDTNIDNAIYFAQKEIDNFDKKWDKSYYLMMLDKIGIEKKSKKDRLLIDELLLLMNQEKLDYTNTFTLLSTESGISNLCNENPPLKKWIVKWQKRLLKNSNGFETAQNIMTKVNPIFIPRNHNVERVLDEACNGNFNNFNILINILKTPYTYQSEHSNYLNPSSLEFETNYKTFCGT